MAMKKPESARSDKRVIWIGRLVFLWAAVIVAQLIRLQIIQYDEYRRIADRQQIHVLTEAPDRGSITDRTGHTLAVSERTRTAVINPQQVANPALFAEAVGDPLDLTPGQRAALAARIQQLQSIAAMRKAGQALSPEQKKESVNQLVLARHIRPEQEDRLKKLPFRGLEVLRDTRRLYPNRTLAAHVVGTMGYEGEARMLTGVAGIERKLDADLRGTPGILRALTDARQDRYITLPLKAGVPGANIVLTIDQVMQDAAEQALAAAVEKHHGKSGFLVAMDPRNGEVLALAVVPGFDPSVEKPSADEIEARRNLIVSVPLEPGSVMKMITVAAGLDAGRVTAGDIIYCEAGAWSYGGRQTIHDLHKYGSLTVADVLRLSSNIGAAKIADRIGQKLMYDYMTRFGIGQPTGIESPGESPGLFKPMGKWWTYSHHYMAFGHEVAMTPIQLARAVAVIANGGKLVTPTLVLRKEYVDPATGERRVQEPERPAPRQVLKSETAVLVQRLMYDVVETGTGKPAQVAGYTAGGKTGTAELIDPRTGQYLKHRNAASFIGFAPVNDPRIVVAATVYDTSQKGGPAAGPVFSEVTRAALRVMNVPQDKIPARALAEAKPPEAAAGPAPAPPTAPVPDGRNLVGPRTPDFRGKTIPDVVRESASLGLEVRIIGEGRARRQQPGAGAILPAGSPVRVEFARE